MANANLGASFGSQNFVLKLSESCVSNATRFRSDTNTIVSISDSDSSKENTPIFKTARKPLAVNNRKPLDMIVIESSDSDQEIIRMNQQSQGMISLDSDDDSVLKVVKIDSYKPNKNEGLNPPRSSSGELSFGSNRNLKKGEKGWRRKSNSSSGSSSTNCSSSLLRSRTRPGGKTVISETSSNDETNTGLNSSRSRSKNSSKLLGNQTQAYDAVKLTKKDALGIFKGGNSHWTPKVDLKILTDSCSSQSQAVEKTRERRIISESSSEEAEIINNSITQDLKPRKNHLSRFVNTPNQEQKHYSSLSDRKKTEISHWLMNNTPGSSSNSSIISEGNRNSSFGNSSLERFELKHETPNNRGKIKPPTSETSKATPEQTAIDRFVYKGKTSVVKPQTPVLQKEVATPIDQTRKKTLPVVRDVQNLQIEDCADILDKLYGDVWRSKADEVFTPRTEPRARTKEPINKGRSKTEKKPTAKQNFLLISSSDEDDEFDRQLRTARPIFNSTRKKTRDSFIDDKSPSENSNESFYHTALTNPRESKGPQSIARPVSASTKRAVAICDSESDIEENNYRPIFDQDENRKRLSFSEDESDSSTSEFDPGEEVPPKAKGKKAPVKTHRPKAKNTDRSQAPAGLANCDQRTKSFLASLSNTVPIQNCHPQARVYRDNYKNKKEELARYLFQFYNKHIFDEKLPNDMPIEWNVRMRGTAGYCYNRKSVRALGGVVRSSRIVLATKILDTPDRLRDTLIHEMCHAAAWLVNSVSDGHGPYWKGWASKAVKTFPELPPIKRCHDYKIKTKFTYRCTKCGYSIGRHSKSLDIDSKRCGHCYGKFELLINRTTRSGTGQVSTPVQAKTPSGFALFVKENYHTVKKNRQSIKHAEVMRILGQQFSAVKIIKKQGIDEAMTC